MSQSSKINFFPWYSAQCVDLFMGISCTPVSNPVQHSVMLEHYMTLLCSLPSPCLLLVLKRFIPSWNIMLIYLLYSQHLQFRFQCCTLPLSVESTCLESRLCCGTSAPCPSVSEWGSDIPFLQLRVLGINIMHVLQPMIWSQILCLWLKSWL